MKNALILPLFLFLPFLATAQAATDTAACVVSTCENLTGWADSTMLEKCPTFQYRTEALDLSGLPITVLYKVTKDSCLVSWTGYTFYQSGNTSMNRRESMQAYNLVLHNLFPDE